MNFDMYEAEDFLLEESFRNYCLGINDKDVQFWQEWIVAHQARQPVIQQARELYFVLNGNITAGQYKEHETIFREKLQQHIAGEVVPIPQKRPVKRLLVYAGIAAASVVLCVVLFMQWLQSPKPVQYTAVHEAKPGQKKQLQLPDGTKVTLNAGSSLKVAGSFLSAARETGLDGEAFFEVAHHTGRPFIIHTSVMDIKVLGTVFSVKAYANDVTAETALLKGSVEVTLHNAAEKKILLHPGEKIVLANTRIARVEPLNYQADSSLVEVSWLQNKLEFNNEPLEKIAAVLERWYNVKVVIEDSAIATYQYTGVFEQKTVDQVLKALQLSRPFNYTIDKNKVIHIRK
jgi:ferric-dicitrate binding protein FerR (iron transport regulator)